MGMQRRMSFSPELASEVMPRLLESLLPEIDLRDLFDRKKVKLTGSEVRDLMIGTWLQGYGYALRDLSEVIDSEIDLPVFTARMQELMA